MPDMLVKLYEVEQDWSFLAEQEAHGVTVRKPIGPEKHLVVDWVRATFSDTWASETDQAFANRPISCFIATADSRLVGFACYDATALGLFGPIGVEKDLRGRDIGSALLKACLLDMRLKGYAYAVIGSTKAFSFYEKVCGATVLPESEPSIWRGMLRRAKPQP